ncbi:Phospholipase_D-nuclease N-terminal [Jatrophihabitans endophyticus]|uniref:Phospholipase_D-nuclease N-terminal n=1 Tax=Jatrophihabitans endophyticus TaxID=1206085 RepID=A0A1M5KT09_9ACTN|nr:PLDc N-terminal domain-containing protein [Jatrophihabitans endophyticus]SHG55911.1 Phospholipase_D-nuclease N-terminal [Jatrophihabitans endophyticus]
MVLFGGALGLLALGVWIFCVIDAITTPADQVRTLPKLLWVLVVVLLADVGSLAWLIAGRPWNARATTPRGAGRGTAGYGMSALPARRAQARPLSPDDDDEFLAGLAERNEQQRRREQGGDGAGPVT